MTRRGIFIGGCGGGEGWRRELAFLRQILWSQFFRGEKREVSVMCVQVVVGKVGKPLNSLVVLGGR